MRLRKEVAFLSALALASAAVTHMVLGWARPGATADEPTAAAPPAVLPLGTSGRLVMTGGFFQEPDSGPETSAHWTLANAGANPLRIRLARVCDCTHANLRPGEVHTIAPGSALEFTASYRRTLDLTLQTSDPAHREVRLRTPTVIPDEE
jgi:hypothetical protein